MDIIELLIDALGVGGFFLLLMTVGGLIGCIYLHLDNKPRR